MLIRQAILWTALSVLVLIVVLALILSIVEGPALPARPRGNLITSDFEKLLFKYESSRYSDTAYAEVVDEIKAGEGLIRFRDYQVIWPLQKSPEISALLRLVKAMEAKGDVLSLNRLIERWHVESHEALVVKMRVYKYLVLVDGERKSLRQRLKMDVVDAVVYDKIRYDWFMRNPSIFHIVVNASQSEEGIMDYKWEDQRVSMLDYLFLDDLRGAGAMGFGGYFELLRNAIINDDYSKALEVVQEANVVADQKDGGGNPELPVAFLSWKSWGPPVRLLIELKASKEK